jgi:diketogulonate reductase-like aldo/keto reductase
VKSFHSNWLVLWYCRLRLNTHVALASLSNPDSQKQFPGQSFCLALIGSDSQLRQASASIARRTQSSFGLASRYAKALLIASCRVRYVPPDWSVPFTETLRTVNKLYEEGKFKQLGLSNYTAFEVAEIVVTCKERGWVRPTIYQGRYVLRCHQESHPYFSLLTVHFSANQITLFSRTPP